MAEIEIGNKKIELDGDGFMVDPTQWNDELAAAIAKADGIEELTENHWKVVRIIRSNFEEKGLAPMVRTICTLPTGSRKRSLPCGRSAQTRRLRIVVSKKLLPC